MNKIGVADYGMGVWEGGAFSTERRLAVVKECGYDGIEVLRGRSVEDMVNKAAIYRKLGMEFISCNVADDHENTFRCAAALGCEYVWLNCGKSTRDVPYDVYIRRAKEYVKAAADWGMKCALHNHLGTRIENQEEVHLFMEKVPGAQLLLDIGHLYGAGGDPVEIIHKYADRIAAVHFKDIEMKDESIGLDKWYDRLRFCELGAGTPGLVDYDACVKALCEVGYDKWVLVEHDTHTDDPFKQLKISLDRLKESFAKYSQ